jgi:hypothetical protein
MAHPYFSLLRYFSHKMYTKFFKSLLAITFNNLFKYANYAFIVYMCTQIKKLSHNIFHYIFHSSDTIGPFL